MNLSAKKLRTVIRKLDDVRYIYLLFSQVEEVAKVLSVMNGINQLMTRIMYGGGLRRCELVRLRVQDVEISNRQIIVRRAKGDKDRVTLLGESVIDELLRHLEHRKHVHDEDLSNGVGSVYLPFALERKYPKAPYE